MASTSDLAALGSLAPLIINMLKGSSQPNPGALLGTVPGGQDLLNNVVGQQQQQAPLRQAVTQQAMNMLPNGAFPGGRPTLAPVGPGAAPATSGSGTDIAKLLGAGAAGAGLAALLSHLANGANSGGSIPIGDLIKKLFGHGGAPGNTGQPTGLNLGPFENNPYPDFLNTGTLSPTDRSAPTPNVDTSTTFNGVQGGYPNNPEDPSSIDPNWGGLTGGGGTGGNDGWDE